MRTLYLLFIISLTGCSAGNGEGLDSDGQPVSDGLDAEATLTWIQDNVFSVICADCHAGANPAAGQDLSTMDNAVQNLINVPSSNPEFVRVKPGAPEQSYLFLKITGDPRAGARMPLGRAPLPQSTIDAIESWIQQGAQVPDVATTTVRVIRTRVDIERSIQVEPNKALRRVKLTLWFNKPMDFSPLDNSKLLIAANIPGQQIAIEPEQTHLSIQAPNILSIQIAELASDAESISLRLNSGNISTLSSNTGQWLDGDKDGLDGGEFEYEIRL